MSLEITYKENRGVGILTLAGPLTFGNSILVFRMVFDGLLDEGKVHLALNLTKLSELDAAGAGTLLYARRESQKAGGDLAVFGLRRSLIEPRVEAKLEPFTKVFVTEEEAVDSFFPKHYDVLDLVRSMKRRNYSPAQQSY
jgi:anti-anti-sigma factor